MTIRVGDRGQVQTVLRPGGNVIIRGRAYSAMSNGSLLEPGEEVVVLGGSHQGLRVSPLSSIPNPNDLPHFGQIVFASFGDRARAEGQLKEELTQSWIQDRSLWILRVGMILGAIAGTAALMLSWHPLREQFSEWVRWPIALGTILTGACWGVALLRLVDKLLKDISPMLYTFSLPVTCLVFYGLIHGAVYGIPWLAEHYGTERVVLVLVLLGLVAPLAAMQGWHSLDHRHPEFDSHSGP